MVDLFCPKCHAQLLKEEKKYTCTSCGFSFEKKDKVWVDESCLQDKDRVFYDNLYETEHGQKWFQGLNRSSFAKRILEKVSLSYRRERFFLQNIKGKNNLVLDLACGAGRDYFKQFGEVVGIDLSFAPLRQAQERYDLVVQTGCDALPFADNTFDYVVSSDFFGHVRPEDKDKILKEILRVLKPGGKTLHIIETDSENFWLKFAHKYPDLFYKYFIEKIGGHVGLEMPSACVRRWKNNNFEIIKAKKIWGLIWPIKDYSSMFDNEYKEKSIFIRVVVGISKFLSKLKLSEVAINIILNPINSFLESLLSIDKGNGLMLMAAKQKNIK